MEEDDLERLVLPALLAPAPAARFAEVAPGDTASWIGKKAAISVGRLAEPNPSIDLDTLRPGQTLKLAR